MQPSIVHRIFWGLILVGVGAAFLLNQLGVVSIDIGELFSVYWPVILILIGVQGLLIQHRGGFWWNPFVTLIGVYFLGRNLDWFEWNFGDMMKIIGPVILIIWGICILTHGGRRSRSKRWETDGWSSVTPPDSPAPPEPPAPPAPPELTQPPESDSPKASASSGGSFKEIPAPNPPYHDTQYWKHRYWKEHHRQPWSDGYDHAARESHSRFIGDFVFDHDHFELKPMSISHFIGDTKLDLTRAQIPLGETRIYVSTFIGDVKVFVPDDYSVGVRVVSSSLIGDVKVMDQKRGGLFNQVNVETPRFIDASKQVVLVVNTFIGDVRVTKVG